MTWIENTLREFGRQIGLGQLEFNRHGLVQLRFENGDYLAVEPGPRGEREEVLIYMGRPVGHHAPTMLRAALTRAHAIDGGAPFVQIGLLGEGSDTQLLAVVRLKDRNFTPQSLAQSFAYLGRWLDTVQSGSTR